VRGSVVRILLSKTQARLNDRALYAMSVLQECEKMPLYGFHCAECDKDSELLLRFSDVPVCPACGSGKMERSVSRVAPELKSDAIKKSWRAKAKREGDLSNFSKSELK
jgi:putative FmdB family regulatory protein